MESPEDSSPELFLNRRTHDVVHFRELRIEVGVALEESLYPELRAGP